jgi:hypothetical protein
MILKSYLARRKMVHQQQTAEALDDKELGGRDTNRSTESEGPKVEVV